MKSKIEIIGLSLAVLLLVVVWWANGRDDSWLYLSSIAVIISASSLWYSKEK